jgi:hypothetical protein
LSNEVSNSIKHVDEMSFALQNENSFNVGEVLHIVKKLKVKKACGYDRINNRLVKNFPLEVLELLLKLYNISQDHHYPLALDP